MVAGGVTVLGAGSVAVGFGGAVTVEDTLVTVGDGEDVLNSLVAG